MATAYPVSSDNELLVEEGSLYPTLQRLEFDGGQVRYQVALNYATYHYLIPNVCPGHPMMLTLVLLSTRCLTFGNTSTPLDEAPLQSGCELSTFRGGNGA